MFATRLLRLGVVAMLLATAVVDGRAVQSTARSVAAQGVIMGRVVDAVTGAPLDDSTVFLQAGFELAGKRTAIVRADDDGIALSDGEHKRQDLRVGTTSTIERSRR